MEVGNNPFPSEEVTGLAAFENLEPVSSLSVVPEDSEESQPPAARPAASEAAGAPGKDRERLDKTLPLDLSVVHKSQKLRPRAPEDRHDAHSRHGDEEQELEPAPEDEVPAAEVARLDGAQSHAAAAEPSADHLFDGSVQAESRPEPEVPLAAEPAGLGWDDDEATRVITPLSAQDAHEAAPRADATAPSLPMDWDDEEPPTTMRPGAMFEGSPVPDKSGWEEDAEDNRTQIYDGALSEADSDSEVDEPVLPPAPRRKPVSATQTLTGGQPSPFPVPAALPPHAPALSTAAARVAAGDATVPERFLEAVKSGDKRSWLVLGGGASGLVLLALIVRAAGGAPAASSAVFSTKPLDAKVSVDGKEVPGSGSPYSLADLAPGSHKLVVTKPGYEDYSGTFTLHRGESKNLPAIELTASAREVGFAIRSTPEGAAVWVDGQPTDQVTPARLTGVTPGIHRLQLKLEGHGDYELQMFVPDGTLLQLPAAELTPSPEAHAAKPARAARARKADEDEDLASAAPRSSWRSRKAAEADEDDTRSARSARKSSSDAEPARPAAASSAAVSGKLGTLRLNTRPWAQVIVDGRMVGNTPQPNLQLSAGKHKLRLINQPLGVNKTVTVTIKAGEVTTQVLNLAE